MRDDTQNLEQTLNLAKNNCWTRCPGCSYIVEMRVNIDYAVSILMNPNICDRMGVTTYNATVASHCK